MVQQEILYKGIFYLELLQSFCSAQNHLCNFGNGHYEYFCEIMLNWTNGSGGHAVKRYFLSRALAALCSAEQNHLCNFSRRISVK